MLSEYAVKHRCGQCGERVISQLDWLDQVGLLGQLGQLGWGRISQSTSSSKGAGAVVQGLLEDWVGWLGRAVRGLKSAL